MNAIRMITSLLIFLALNIYLFIRGWQAMPARAIVHVIYSALFVLASCSMFVSVFAAGKLPLWVTYIFDVIGGYWMILFIFLLSAALLGDLLRIANHFFDIFPRWMTLNWGQTKLIYLLLVFVFLLMVSFTGFETYAKPHIKDLKIKTGKTVRDDLTIIAASDIHLGNVIRKGRLTKWVDIINRQNPDIILLAGDVFDHNMRPVEAQKMYMELAKLHARFGVYAVPGNHDYYAGIDKAMNYLKKSGINVLRDESVMIDSSVIIIGRDDLSNKSRKTLAALMEGINTSLPVIVLDHQPASIDESVENNIDLHLSGHTHNGQIFPYNKIVSKIYRVGYGYKKLGNTTVYVTSGLGLWGAPLRFGTRSEIVRIRLE